MVSQLSSPADLVDVVVQACTQFRKQNICVLFKKFQRDSHFVKIHQLRERTEVGGTTYDFDIWVCATRRSKG